MNDTNPAPEATDEETPLEELLPEIDPRELEIVQLQEQLAQSKDRLLRLAADSENMRKRLEREKAEGALYAATNFARDLLSVADNMGRALKAVDREHLEGATRSLMEGVEATERELLASFQRHGIRKLEPLGEKFDPNMHQAIFEVPTNDQPPGTVAQVMQDGYAIGDRCLRPAMVGVAKTAEG
jgi:molecular chaperone GrpE